LSLANQTGVPVVGFIRSTPAGPFAHYEIAFGKGLAETGFIAGKNVMIEQRYADNQLDRLPSLVEGLIKRRVGVIVGNTIAVSAARAASATIPIVFVSGQDPVVQGLVSNLRRPGGNITGITFFGGAPLVAKRIELLHELAASDRAIAVLHDPNALVGENMSTEALAAGRAIGRQVIILQIATEDQIEPAFAKIAQAGVAGLVIDGSALFTSMRRELVALAARHRLPTVYDSRDFVVDGGLISYSGNIADAYRLAGVYAGRILKGAKPSDLPVQQPTKIELVVSLKTAKALGITVPQTILVRADEVIR
jgi:putative ABC transport system substrate-binding protein